VSGTVRAVNDQLRDAPEILNADPYGQGWICELEISDAAQLDGLLDASDYAKLTDS
jgi:glycine cleavage system H protein